MPLWHKVCMHLAEIQIVIKDRSHRDMKCQKEPVPGFEMASAKVSNAGNPGNPCKPLASPYKPLVNPTHALYTHNLPWKGHTCPLQGFFTFADVYCQFAFFSWSGCQRHRQKQNKVLKCKSRWLY